jgi:hypothetical protein
METQSDESFYPTDWSENESSGVETCEEYGDSEVVSVHGGDDTSGEEGHGTYWNGLWYATSDDYDSDGIGDYCTSEGVFASDTDDSNTGGQQEDCEHGTPYPKSPPTSM